MLAFLVAFSCFFTFVNGNNIFPQVGYLLGDIAINCGTVNNSTALDGRRWVGETPLLLPTNGISTSSISAHHHKLLSADPTPYFTARLSFSYFSYLFHVTPGQKFVRLHFYPGSYQGGFENSRDFFTVKANSFTLLYNFSTSLAADALGVNYVVKEYCLNVNETGILQITFSALQRSSKTNKFYTFVNGIEIISMPTGLYFTLDDSLGPRIVGQTNRFHYVDNSTALELVQRLNVGGSTISTVDDTGLFRKWVGDVDYIQINTFSLTENTISQPVVAPPKIYQTSRKFRKNLQLEDQFTWKIHVDVGFSYLLRLHFSFFGIEIPEGGTEEFNMLIQNIVAETGINVIQLRGGERTLVYKDYLVMMKGDKAEGKTDLFISLQSFDELVLGLLNGIEIFKLSNTENSLASPNPSGTEHISLNWTLKIQNFFIDIGKLNGIMIVVTIFLAIVNSCVYMLRRICEYTFWQEKNVQSSTTDEPSYHQFSLTEILLATEDFNEALVIGKGGFGKVYKGIIHGRPEILAIKRLKPDSKQGAREFWSEIETLSTLRHVHLVSLLGYCTEREEMIIVYEYMPRGTIADNLYKPNTDEKERIPLTWEQRLRICTGAARGLDYLHTGTQHGVIHRDVKDTNILLDENLVAKVSDFGLSKPGKIGEIKGELSTKVIGTIGYLDPEYIMTHKLSTKSDVYAFGVVLLVMISGRPAVERRLFEETKSLLDCYRECVTKGEMNEIIDPCLHGEILKGSLTRFMEVVGNCLHRHPKKRPTMAQVVAHLEIVLEEQINTVSFTLCADSVAGQNPPVGSNRPFESYESQVAQIPEESIISLPSEGLHTKVEVLQSKGKNRNVFQKPLWARPWTAFRKFRKPGKKMELTLRTARAFSFKDIKLATENFADKSLIGKGGFFNVYKGFIDSSSGIVAIKRYGSSGAEEFRAEVEILSTIHHTHFLHFVGFCNESNELIVVYEYMSWGSLGMHIYRKNNGSRKSNIYFLPSNIYFTWEERLRICIGVARGLNYLHEVGVIHRDVKDENILLDENFVAKIAGFGLSKGAGFGESATHFTTQTVGTPGYLDPSYYISSRLTKASDVYSFGIVLLVLLSGMPAIDISRPEEHRHVKSWYDTCSEDENFEELIDPILLGGIPSASLSKFLELINNCLQEDLKVRPIMAQVVANLEESLSLAAKMDSETGVI